MKKEQDLSKTNDKNEKENSKSYIVIGFIIGAIFGVMNENLAVWAAFGMCVGFIVDAIHAKRKN